jgi:hypothetical protein
MPGLRRPRSSCSNTLFLIRLALIRLVLRSLPAGGQSPDAALLASLTEDFARLAPETVRPAQGDIRFPYMIPAGHYDQLWDWDGFFVDLHWANQNPADARYLRDWVLAFHSSSDQSPSRKSAGFVGWKLLAEDMIQCEVGKEHCLMLSDDRAADP